MKKRVLVVEDSDTNRQLLEDLLEKVFDCTVIAVGDGQQAVDTALSEMPDLILMDLGLPVMDGDVAGQKIKANEKTKDIPILALTGYSSLSDEQRMMDLGFDGFLPKPFDVPTLIKKVSVYIPTAIEM